MSADLTLGAKRPPREDHAVTSETFPDLGSPVLALIRSFCPDVEQSDYHRRLTDLPVDSFALLELRLGAEQVIGHPIPDREWLDLGTPLAIIGYLEARLRGEAFIPRHDGVASATRSCVLNMPQMSLGGLSESWLWKQIGDLHWEMICTGLQAQSHELLDGSNNRLYATFTRLKIDLSVPLVDFNENDLLDMSGRISRFGGGLFFSDVEAVSAGKTARASIMSSFTKRGSLTSNANLLKGQPTIPAECPIPDLGAMPPFGCGYRDRRGMAPEPVEFECEYQILPCHDINGVGLLYFAAYPSISDICEIKYMNKGNRWACESSVIGRDIFYFSNCDIEDHILYRVHSCRHQGRVIEIHASLTRKSDNTLMAYVVTRKVVHDA